MGTPTLVIARTDAEAADLVTSDVDDNDKPFLTGERTVEGFYRTRPGLDQAVSRGLAYSEYADMVWCETGKPDLAYAKAFAEAIHKKFPGKLLAYNCSPSFNWKKNLDDATIAKFQRELGAMGYKFQFITLAGFHSLNYSMFNLAHGYARNSMTRVRRAAGGRVRRRREGLHRRQAPARGRHRLLRRRDDDDRARRLDRRAQGLDRGRAVLRPQARLIRPAAPGGPTLGAGPRRLLRPTAPRRAIFSCGVRRRRAGIRSNRPHVGGLRRLRQRPAHGPVGQLPAARQQ